MNGMTIDNFHSFLLTELVPSVDRFANQQGVHMNEAAVASLCGLSTLLQVNGYTIDQIVALIKGAGLGAHEEAKEMQ